MSEEKPDAVVSKEKESNPDPQFVKKDAYEQVSKDMHKYKSQKKELEASLNEYQAKLKAIEEQGMRDKEQWKELYESQKAEVESERLKSAEREKSYNDSVKRSALKQELVGVKDEYLNFANLAALELDEYGNVDQQTLHQVVNEFRQNHGALIPAANKTTITQAAAPTDNTLQLDKPLESMTLAEKIALLKQKTGEA